MSSVGKIINAMEMVASTKLIKAGQVLDGIRPMQIDLQRIINDLARIDETNEHLYFKERKVNNSLYIVMTSDRGLSGGFNSNIGKAALAHMNEGKNEKMVVIGSKGIDFFNKHQKNIVRSVYDISDDNVYYGAESIAQTLLDRYLTGDVDEVYIAFTYFKNVLTLEPRIMKLLPIDVSAFDEILKQTKVSEQEALYEPTLEEFIDHIVPLYLHMSIFRAFSESHTSENAARMINMDTAGKNAEDLVEDLNRQFNRKRQEAITQELNEIVGSAASMKKGGNNDE